MAWEAGDVVKETRNMTEGDYMLLSEALASGALSSWRDMEATLEFALGKKKKAQINYVIKDKMPSYSLGGESEYELPSALEPA